MVSGRKWFVTGALDPTCAVFVVMGRTDPDGPRQRRQSQLLVPRDTPGVTVRRGLRTFGCDDSDHGGHAEIQAIKIAVPRTVESGHPGARGGRPQSGHPRWPGSGCEPARCAWPTARTRCTGSRWPVASCADTAPTRRRRTSRLGGQ
ncbi:hypothetical protein TPA0908_40500 [Micromonospora sp. AKA38]|nr:hypothetical protein TPA0908_40500 [Micromonospora sp. AKA38]